MRHTEDLLTYVLPETHSYGHPDLHALKQRTDETRKRRHESAETRMIDSQHELRSLMLQTQEVTFKLERKVAALINKFGMQQDNLEGQLEMMTMMTINPVAVHGGRSRDMSESGGGGGGGAGGGGPSEGVSTSSSTKSDGTPSAAASSTPAPQQPPTQPSSASGGRRRSVLSDAMLSFEASSAGGAGSSEAAKEDSSSSLARAASMQRNLLPRSASGADLSMLSHKSYEGVGPNVDMIEDELTAQLQSQIKKERQVVDKLKLELQRRDALVHKKARSQETPTYPIRCAVPDSQVNWSSTWKEYAPLEFTDEVVFRFDCTIKKGGWADPKEPTTIKPKEWQERVSYEGDIVFTALGRPRNPRGRTGMSGRGLLGKWGPNHAADPIVTRYNPAYKEGRQLQMVAIKRKDTKAKYDDGTHHDVWAIPGGMVDAGETVSQTVRREFTEEAGNLATKEQRGRFEKLADELFASGRVVYRGYVDDPRNTDNAWIETTAFHYHCNMELGQMMPLKAGDDAADVMWLNVDDDEPKYKHLHASHREWVDQIRDEMRDEMAMRG